MMAMFGKMEKIYIKILHKKDTIKSQKKSNNIIYAIFENGIFNFQTA
jgi:predicted transcriptional regulator YheO